MESNNIDNNYYEYEIYKYIKYSFAVIGIISYVITCLIFVLYLKIPNLIKNEIFTYILFHSIKSLVEIILPQLLGIILIYIFDIIELILILSYLNKCFTSKNISENTNLYELNYRYIIVSIYIICSFPYEKFFKLIDQYIFSLYILNLISAIIFFRYINIKMNLILEYLKEKKVTNSSIPDLYLPYVKANFYFTYLNKINNIFYFSFSLVIIYYIINILNLFFYFNIIYKYLILFSQELFYFCIVISCLIYFYCLNKDIFDNKIQNEKEDNDINKFRVIDIDIQQEEDDILDKNNKILNEKNILNNKEEDNHENKKNNEETEKLKN